MGVCVVACVCALFVLYAPWVSVLCAACVVACVLSCAACVLAYVWRKCGVRTRCLRGGS
jgi:hypothetical protein